MPSLASCPVPANVSAHAAAALVLLAFAMPVRPHHTNTIYDTDTELTLAGVVTGYEWANPHVYVFVEAAAAAGRPAGVWTIEASPPLIMARRGWTPATLQAGDRVVATVNPRRDAVSLAGLGKAVRTAAGETYCVNRCPQDQAALGATDLPRTAAEGLAGTWVARLDPTVTMKFVQPQGSEDTPGMGVRSWPLTARGFEAVDAYDIATSPAAECIPYTAPFSMVFPDLKIIEVGPESVTIRSELDDAERVIQLHAGSHGTAPFTNQGHAIGRFEGDALVVETARFSARQDGNTVRLPSSRQKRLVERFEMNADSTALTYSFELEDPEYLTESMSGRIEWLYAPGRTFAARGCDLDNAGRFLDD